MEALQLAVKLHHSRRFSDAEKIYRQLLAVPGFEAKAANLLGVLAFETGRSAVAKEFFERAIAAGPAFETNYTNYAVAYERAGDFPAAILVCERGLSQIQESIRLREKLCAYYVKVKQYEKAISVGQYVVQLDPSMFSVWFQLNAAYFFCNRMSEAIDCGNRALLTRDQSCCNRANRTAPQPLPPARKTGQDVIAFSLWGNNEFYTLGAIRNAELAQKLYPGWTCRFYCGKSTPLPVLDRLRSMDCQVIMMEDAEGFSGAIWRFLVADDPKVRRFICRDADSRLNPRDKAAVDQWIESGKSFHIMRDAVVHCDLILAGMWGGYAGVLPNMRDMIGPSFNGHNKFADQDFLATTIWPIVKPDSLIHDRVYRCFGAKPFPEGADQEASHHIGAGVPVSWDPPKPLEN